MNAKPFRYANGILCIVLLATLPACSPLNGDAVDVVVEPFLFADRLQANTNNPYDDFQAVIEIPQDKIVIIEFVSASVFGDLKDNEEFVLTVSGAAHSSRGTFRPRHFVTKLERLDRVSRDGKTMTYHIGGGAVKTYAMASKPPGFHSSINLSVTSNLAVGDYRSEPRQLYADVQLSGRLVDAAP